MASSERDSKAIPGPEARAADATLGPSVAAGRTPARKGAQAQAKTDAKKGPRINLALADPTRVKVVRKSRTPSPPAEQRSGAAPGPEPKLERPASGPERSQSPQNALVWRTVATEQLHSSWLRPRTPYDEGTIQSLAGPLRTAGWQHPILVRPHPVIARDYEIVVGELPAQAARRAGLEEVTVVVCRLSDRRALECVLLEDARRPDLTPFETAVGYGQLIRTFHYSLPVLAKLVGKSEPQVVRTLLLLDSSKVARDTRDVPVAWPGAGRPSTAASGAAKPDIAPDIASDVASSAGGAEGPEGTALSREPALSKEMAALERHLSRALGLDVAVSAKGGEGGLRISYANLEQLEWLVRHLLSMEVHREPAPTCPGLAA